MLTTPDGTKVHGEYFSHLFYNTPSVLEFRVVQETARDIVVWLRLRDQLPRLPEGELTPLRRAFTELFGAAVGNRLRESKQCRLRRHGSSRGPAAAARG